MPRLREMARFVKERATPKMKTGLLLMHEQAKRAVPVVKRGAEVSYALTRNKIAPKMKEHAFRAAEFTKRTLAPKAQRSLTVAFAAFVNANRKAAQLMKERGIPAAKKAGQFTKERALPFAARAGKEVTRVVRERTIPAAQTLYEKTLITAATAGKKSRWERDVATLSVKTGVDRRRIERILNTMAKAGVPRGDARKALVSIHENYGKEHANFALSRLHEDVKKGIDPIVAHNAMIKTLEVLKRNPELAKRAEQIYLVARAMEFLKTAEPPAPDEIEGMRLNELKEYLKRQHPGGFGA